MASINTHYAKSPQIVDLTPLLALGRSGNISLKVVGMDEASERYNSTYFSIIAGGALLAWTDPSKAVLGGSLSKSYASYSRSPSITDIGVYEVSSYFEKTYYRIQYEALLNTARWVINASTYSEGYTIASIYMSPSILISTLVQNFTNRAWGSGAVEYSMDSRGDYIIRVTNKFTFTPTSDPTKILYDATLDEDDEIDVWLVRSYSNRHGSDWYSESMYERAYVVGGFSVNLTVIDPYGGAVITALTRASSTTTKSLAALILYSGKGYTEEFKIVTQADLSRPFGFFREFYIRYFRI